MLKKLNIGGDDVVSFAGLAISLIGWFGVTPERFGQMAFDVTQIVIPVFDFGLGAFFMHARMSKRHNAEKNGLEARVEQAEGRAQAYAEGVDLTKEENKILANKINELESEKIKPDFGYLSNEEKAMVASAFDGCEPFPTPDTSVFTYPDITLSQLQKRNIVKKAGAKKVGVSEIVLWQIERAASEALNGNPDLLDDCRSAYTHVYDAAVKKREEEEREEQEELLDNYSCKLSQVDNRSRAMLRALILGYNVYVPSSHWSEDSYDYDPLLQSLVGWEYEFDSSVQLFPTSLLMDVYSYDPELFERNVDDYLPEREGAPNGWKTDGLGFAPRFDFPWYWEKNEGDEHVQ